MADKASVRESVKTMVPGSAKEPQAVLQEFKLSQSDYSDFCEANTVVIVKQLLKLLRSNYFSYLENRILNKSYYQVCKRDKQDIRETNLLTD